MSDQLVFDSIVLDAWRAQDALFDAYARRHAETYRQYAVAITPDLTHWRAVWDRVAFAILSANTGSAMAAFALHALRAERDQSVRVESVPGITTDRLDYVRALPSGASAVTLLCRQPDEPWDLYRLRLRYDQRGLGITKASYAVALLYPLDADVCCLDVWMQRFLYRDRAHDFLWLNDDAYRALENRVRRIANGLPCSTALAQWIMWDFIRTGFPTPQDFFS